jgi:hypothetical protein
MKIRPLTAILALTSLLYTACLSVTSEPTDDSDDLIADIETGVEDEPETGDNTPTGAGQPPTQKDVGVLCVDDQGNQEGDSCIDPCTEAFGDYGCNEAGELVCVPYEAVTNLLWRNSILGCCGRKSTSCKR